MNKLIQYFIGYVQGLLFEKDLTDVISINKSKIITIDDIKYQISIKLEQL